MLHDDPKLEADSYGTGRDVQLHDIRLRNFAFFAKYCGQGYAWRHLTA